MMATPLIINRKWAMPDPNTFAIPPIRDLLKRYVSHSKVSVDPFSRNSRLATHTNDLNPETCAESHCDAEEFLRGLSAKGVQADLVLFDPPYSPRQISECYQSVGREVGMEGTQNGKLYKRVRDAILPVLAPRGTVISFGWNSSGMGLVRGFNQIEILLVCHGGGHNDTIVTVEVKQPHLFDGAVNEGP